MAVSIERSCSMIVHLDKPGNANEIKAALEGSDGELKTSMLKKAIAMTLQGEEIPGLFICLIRYVLPSEDHTIQRLLLLYLETIEKTDENGKLLPEMILICQNLRNNLQHPNEYIRGVTLRFLCRIREEDILEPLVPSILSNLEHRHSIVRRNAVMCLNELYKLPKGDLLFQDAPELVETFLAGEQDVSARRNAFLFLCQHDPDRAVKYLSSQADKIIDWGAILQMAVLELIRKVCRTRPAEKGKYIKIILALLGSTKPAVVYECATTLTTLSRAPTAIRAAANCFCQLLVSHSDNNVKMIVLDRLEALKEAHADVLADMLMDILRALNAPVLDIRKKVLDLGMQLLSPKNINEVVMILKKELMRTQGDEDADQGSDYRQALVRAVHKCAVEFPDTASSVVNLLMDFISDSRAIGALDVAVFVREMMATFPRLHGTLLQQLRLCLPQLQSTRVYTTVLWMLSEYSLSPQDVSAAFTAVLECVGVPPYVDDAGEQWRADGTPAEAAAESGAEPPSPVVKVRPQVLADGTYATQAAVADGGTSRTADASKNGAAAPKHMRGLLRGGDTFLGAVVCVTLTKLLLKMGDGTASSPTLRKQRAEAMLVMAGVLQACERRVASGATGGTAPDMDSFDRVVSCFQLLQRPAPDAVQLWTEAPVEIYQQMLQDKRRRDVSDAQAEAAGKQVQPDDLVDFAHLMHRKGVSQIELEDAVASDLQRATGVTDTSRSPASSLERVLQLTGLSDPVYAEALVIVHQYDVVLDVTIVNRTPDTMQQLCLELSTMGDLKLVERPQNYTLAGFATKRVRANIKVSSTETGVIFGNIVYERGGTADRSVIVLNDIHIDIMDYLSPGRCTDIAFRNSWAEFEWENKVVVMTDISEPKEFMYHIMKQTNLTCLNTDMSLAGDCGFLSANLYARSVFGEEALVNLSIEKTQEGRLAGYTRIRAKSQGIALSLGDKITLKQKSSD